MMANVIGTIVGALLAFYLANRLTLNDSMDSKSGWRKELMDIASKDEITLADIYRIRASVRYYPHLEPTYLSFRWMTNLIIKLCDGYFVEVYKDKKAGTNNGGQNIIIIQSAINSSRQFRRRLTNSTVAVSPENDEIVRIICRYLLKYHWEARQKMRIFRRGRDLMNINDDEPSEEAVRTIQLILEQVDKMSSNQNNNSSKNIKEIIDETLVEAKCYENESKCFKDKIYAFVWLSVAMLILALAYMVLHIDKVMAKDVKINTSREVKVVIENAQVIHNSYGDWVPLLVILGMIIVILLILCIFYNCCSRKCCCKKSGCQMCCCNKCCDSNCCSSSKKQEHSGEPSEKN